jgi:hypothetical protein
MQFKMGIVLLPDASGDGSDLIRRFIPSLMTTVSKQTTTTVYVSLNTDNSPVSHFQSAIESFNAKEPATRNGITVKIVRCKDINHISDVCHEEGNNIVCFSNNAFIFKATGWQDAIKMALTTEHNQIAATPDGRFVALNAKKHRSFFENQIKPDVVREWNVLRWIFGVYKTNGMVCTIPQDSIELIGSDENPDGESKEGEEEHLQEQIKSASDKITS